ncbi:unnamed protein product [Brassica oleracea var. botrytis]
MYHRIPSLMEPILRRVSARWPVIVQATTWTVLLMVTVAVASFAPELAFVSTVSSPCGRGDGFVKIPMDFPGESVCVPSHMVKRSRFDLFMPPIFAAVMVTASACLIRSCFGTEDMDDGAVENVLERSTNIQLLDGSILELDQYLRDLILQSLHDMSMGALRCLGFAYSDVPSDFATYDGSEDHPAHQQLLNPSNYSSIESNLTFVGFVGLRDPLRKELRQAIADYRTAGIRVMVITGDNKSTAESICREIGVFEAGEDISSRSLTGKEFMDVKDQKNHLRQTGGLLFSRAEPKHK